MPELLLEVGTEELPATFVRKAYMDLLALVGDALREAGVLQSEGVAMGTPRRLIVSFPEVKERQEDTTKEQRGPALKAAFDPEGNPTPALLGFCRSQSVEPEDLRRDEQYVWATKKIEGKPTHEVLAEVLPKAIRSLNFDKSMRWGSSRMRFARPIRWILASFEGAAVPFEIEGVEAGVVSYGHRFYAPQPLTATKLNDLLSRLREAKVEPQPELRRAAIEAQAARVASGQADMPEALLEENVFLTEWPTAIQGEFRHEFMELPEPVLVTAMAKHEKMFPVRDADGRLTNKFVFVRNSGVDDSVRIGAEWVLNARFNDAKFFFDEDRKHSLSEFLDKTSGIVFQEKLGTVRQRADRLAALASEIADATGASEEERNHARTAGLQAKADLASGLVGELASLQGIVGGIYARRQGLPDAVCWAIHSQYDLHKSIPIEGADKRTAVRLMIADQLDKLAGYLGLGLEPSGSSDPFGLRRAVTTLIEAAWAWPSAVPPYATLLDLALQQYQRQGVELDRSGALAAMTRLFASRYPALLPQVRYDVMDAALQADNAQDVTAPRVVKVRLQGLEAIADDLQFVYTATRPINIVAAARKKSISIPAEIHKDKLDSKEGLHLLEVLESQQLAVARAAESENAAVLIDSLRPLEQPINAFFDSTMVMVEDEGVRDARLALLDQVSALLMRAGDFSKLVIEG